MFWLVHNGSYRRARSEPRAPVRGADAAADADVVAAASRLLHATCPQMFPPYIGMRQERGRGVWGCVAPRRLCGGGSHKFGFAARRKKKKKKRKKKKKTKKKGGEGESTCSGWSSADDFHVALASSEPEPEPPSRQSSAATAGDSISMAADMEPSE